jgi:hypothetical protein
LLLHGLLVTWLLGCTAAAWWQFGRAASGNSLSYLYSIEWPVFAILGFFGWWSLLHLEKISEAQEQARREYEAKMRAEAAAARAAAVADEDPELKAYNDELARLADQPKKKLWGH